MKASFWCGQCDFVCHNKGIWSAHIATHDNEQDATHDICEHVFLSCEPVIARAPQNEPDAGSDVSSVCSSCSTFIGDEIDSEAEDDDAQRVESNIRDEPRETLWPNANFEFMWWVRGRLQLSRRECEILLDALRTKFDTNLAIPSSMAQVISIEKTITAKTDVREVRLRQITAPKDALGNSVVVEEPVLFLRSIIAAAADILSQPEHHQAAKWRYYKQNQNSKQIFGEILSSTWAKEQQVRIGHFDMLVLIIYLDETSTSYAGRTVYPVYISVGNIPVEYRTSSAAKRLVGFLPTLKFVRAFRCSAAASLYRRQIHNECLRLLLEEIVLNEDGFVLDLPQSPRYVCPVVPFFVCDHVEAQKICLMYGSTQCNRPCRFCTVCPAKEGLISKGSERTQHQMEQLVSVGGAHALKDASVHRQKNHMWRVPGLDVYKIPPCRMHSTDHGVFALLLKLCVEWVARQRVTGEFDTRWAKLGKFPGLKRFRAGVSDLKFVMANEHRAISSCLPFVLHALAPNTENQILTRGAWAYLVWRKMLSKREYTQDDLTELDLYSKEAQAAINDVHNTVRGGDVQLVIKFHTMNHWSDSIVRFGAPTNYDTETWESAHKIFVKPWIGKLGHQPACTLLQRDLQPDDSCTQTQVLHENAQLRGRGVATQLNANADCAVFTHLARDTVVVPWQSIWSETSRCWIRKGHAIAVQDMQGFEQHGFVVNIIEIKANKFVVLAPLTLEAPVTTNHFLYKVATHFPILYRKSQVQKAVVISQTTTFFAVDMQPDFATKNCFFLNNFGL